MQVAIKQGQSCGLPEHDKFMMQARKEMEVAKAAGDHAPAMMKEGYTAADLKAAGFDARSLAEAKLYFHEIAQAGYTVAELKAAGCDARSLLKAKFQLDDIARAGYSAAEL